MLEHPSIRLDPDFIEPIAEVFDPKWVFNTCCQFLADRESGSINSPGALLHRFAHPNQFEAPNSPPGNTAFYYEFSDRVEARHDGPNREQTASAAALEIADVPHAADSGEREQIAYSARQENRHPEDIWAQALHELALQLPQSTFETWVRDTSIISCTEGEFTVGAPHAWAQDWLQKRLRKKIKDILDQLTGRSVQVFFEVRGQQQNRSDIIDTLPEDPAQIHHGNQRRLRRPQSSKGKFITAEQIPVVTTDKIPFEAIAAVWDEPWMAVAVAEFEEMLYLWIGLDIGGDPIRVEAAYNPARPNDTPHIINLKHAYALKQRVPVEQWTGAGLSDPLAPIIEAYQGRPQAAGRH